MRMTNSLSLLSSFGLVLGLLLGLAQPASAMNCSQWNRLSYDQKYESIGRMIDDAMSGQAGRQYKVNRNAIGRCLDSQMQNIFYDFDDTCADSSSAGMQALNNLFKNYIWRCVG
jgi:hypothetical protein